MFQFMICAGSFFSILLSEKSNYHDIRGSHVAHVYIIENPFQMVSFLNVLQKFLPIDKVKILIGVLSPGIELLLPWILYII